MPPEWDKNLNEVCGPKYRFLIMLRRNVNTLRTSPDEEKKKETINRRVVYILKNMDQVNCNSVSKFTVSGSINFSILFLIRF